MAEKSAKRKAIEASLIDEPNDAFLQYTLALLCIREGDVEEGRGFLKALILADPENQVASYQQLGQSYAETDELDDAIDVLSQGVDRARARGDFHALSEMQGLLESLQ